VIITGGSRGIGREITVDFARAGAHLLAFIRLEDAVRNYVISYLDTADRYR
jgi:NAD(P)-dependent dehydrogenase (short-subunit alcohol dehydrogenase family)